MDVLTCTKVLADAQGSVAFPCVYGMLQLLMPAAALRRGGTVCPELATGILAKSAGSPVTRSACHMGSCRGKRAVLRTAQKSLYGLEVLVLLGSGYSSGNKAKNRLLPKREPWN